MRGEGDVAASITVLSDERADFEFLPPITSRHVFAFFVQPPLSDLRDIFEQPLDFRLFWVAAGIHLMTLLIVVTIQWLRLNLGQIQRDTAADLDFRRSIGLVIVTCTCLKSMSIAVLQYSNNDTVTHCSSCGLNRLALQTGTGYLILIDCAGLSYVLLYLVCFSIRLSLRLWSPPCPLKRSRLKICRIC